MPEPGLTYANTFMDYSFNEAKCTVCGQLTPDVAVQIIPLQKDMHTLLQVGVVGYGQWQTSNNSGPGVDPQHPGHYRVNGIGGAANVILPVRKVSVGFKLLKEFSNSYTVQGYSLQITGGITF
jgi:hypothetical protein